MAVFIKVCYNLTIASIMRRTINIIIATIHIFMSRSRKSQLYTAIKITEPIAIIAHDAISLKSTFSNPDLNILIIGARAISPIVAIIQIFNIVEVIGHPYTPKRMPDPIPVMMKQPISFASAFGTPSNMFPKTVAHTSPNTLKIKANTAIIIPITINHVIPFSSK